MATLLTKPVRRKLPCFIFERGNRHPIVTLHPGDRPGRERIEVRLVGRRRTYSANLVGLVEKIMLWDCDRVQREINRRTKELHRGGMNLRSARRQAKEEQKDREQQTQ